MSSLNYICDSKRLFEKYIGTGKMIYSYCTARNKRSTKTHKYLNNHFSDRSQLLQCDSIIVLGPITIFFTDGGINPNFFSTISIVKLYFENGIIRLNFRHQKKNFKNEICMLERVGFHVFCI